MSVCTKKSSSETVQVLCSIDVLSKKKKKLSLTSWQNPNKMHVTSITNVQYT